MKFCEEVYEDICHDVRSGDDDFGIDELLVELGVLALLVRGGYQSVALVLEPLAEAELVFCGAEKFGNLCVTGHVNGCSITRRYRSRP